LSGFEVTGCLHAFAGVLGFEGGEFAAFAANRFDDFMLISRWYTDCLLAQLHHLHSLAIVSDSKEDGRWVRWVRMTRKAGAEWMCILSIARNICQAGANSQKLIS
jgi:hypothetical protein